MTKENKIFKSDCVRQLNEITSSPILYSLLLVYLYV